jgi:gliding motility-associated-like protein
VAYIDPLTFDIGQDTTYCGGFSRVLSAGIPHTVWSTGDTALSITVHSPGLYFGSIIACHDTLRDSILISEKPQPIVHLGNDTTLCNGTTLSLDAATDSASYLWQDATTDSTFIVSSQGLYWVDVTVNGCDKRDSVKILYIGPPGAVSLGTDTTICEDSSLVLNVYQSSSQYHWSTGDTTSSIVAQQEGMYTVTVSNICGSTSASESIMTKQCTCRIAIPTAFSPNNDGKNEHFGVLTQCPVENFKMNIYNRWGQLIFVSNNLTDNWDGTYRNVAQPIGVYVFIVHYKDPYTSEEKAISGNVTLLR